MSAIQDVVKVAADAKQISDQVNALLSRGIAVQIANRTNISLSLVASAHESGGFDPPPDPIIPPDQVSTFGSKGSLGLGLATQGSVQYFGATLNLDYFVQWEVPVLGENTSRSRCDGGGRQYFQAEDSVGAFEQATAKHVISFRPLEDQWRRCAMCATLNHQTGGLDAACVDGRTHDNSVSSNYFMVKGGVFGVTPWLGQHCSKCECMTVAPGLGRCAAGEFHDLSNPGGYALVEGANAPGEAGWQVCATCLGVIRDSSRPCPGGGVHLALPAPALIVLSG